MNTTVIIPGYKPVKTMFVLLQFILFAAMASGQDFYDQSHVLYGHHAQALKTDSAEHYRIYIDKEGFFYPESFIDNRLLMATKGSIKEALAQNKDVLDRIAADYGVPVNESTEERIKLLRKAIETSIVTAINNKAKDYAELAMLIHGFRKSTEYDSVDYTGFEDDSIMAAKIKTVRRNVLYLEVYWDGLYMKRADWCHPGRLKKIYRMFEEYAMPSAERAGLYLRNIASNINGKKIAIVTHSLGAAVANEMLFNNASDSLSMVLEKQFPTPSQETVKILLIAPAVSSLPYDRYQNRNTMVDFLKQDNYQLYLFTNEKDFVLLKKLRILFINFGPGPMKHGRTTLGCNWKNEANLLKQKFIKDYPVSTMEVIEATPAFSAHWVSSYCQSASMDTVLSAMFAEHR